MNLRSQGDEYLFRLDVSAIEEMLRDYATLDLWKAVEEPKRRLRRDLVVGADSNILSEQDLSRAKALEKSGDFHLHVIENAGHWIHVDQPDALTELLVSSAG